MLKIPTFVPFINTFFCFLYLLSVKNIRKYLQKLCKIVALEVITSQQYITQHRTHNKFNYTTIRSMKEVNNQIFKRDTQTQTDIQHKWYTNRHRQNLCLRFYKKYSVFLSFLCFFAVNCCAFLYKKKLFILDTQKEIGEKKLYKNFEVKNACKNRLCPNFF